MMRVVGIILAAGESRRMGRLKALLPFGDKTVIEQVIQSLLHAELAAVTVVLGYRAADIAAVIQPLPVHMLHNPTYQHGMTTSIQVALRDITPIPDAYLLALVDQPHIAPQLIRQLLTACTHTAKGVVIPTYYGKRGHPIILAARYRQDILALGPDQGLHLITRGHPADTLEIPVDTDDILRDMDYQAEYEAELQRWQQRRQ
jgi:molybdenum cofactor cytidylyltransferase